MHRYFEKRRLGLLIAALVLLADAGSKMWVYRHQDNLPLDVIPHFFSLVLAWNRGMSFSFFNGAGIWGPWLLGILAVVAACWFVHWLGDKRDSWRHAAGLGLLIGGALGNVLDRVVHGAVVDFLLFYGRHWYFPVFNLADSAISIGVCLLLWDSIRHR